MKVLLVSPSQRTVYVKPIPPSYPPLGLLYVGAVLEKKHDVEVCDFDADELDDEKFKKIVKEYEPDIIGLTCSAVTEKHARHIARLAKSVKNIPTILGGLYATMMTEECIKRDEFDFVVKGEAEMSILELVDNLDTQKFDNISGLWYKQNGAVVKNQESTFIENLDDLPFPARHLLKNPEKYVPPDAMRHPVTPIMTSRGCPAACTFCCTKYILGRRFRYRSPENIIKEIELCIDQFGIKEFHIMDDVFTLNKERVLKFRDLVVEKNLDVNFVMSNGTRADQIDREILQALKDIGMFSIGFGVESGNAQILKNIQKGESLETIEHAYLLAKEMGFETWAFFMFGHPGETPKTARDTIEFAKKIDPDFVKFLIMQPYPNSAVFNELKEQNLIDNFDYENYGVYTGPVHHLPDLSQEELLAWSRRAYREFYLRPKKILQHLRRIRTFEQLKLNLKSAAYVFRLMK